MAVTIESGPLVIGGQQPSLNNYTPGYNQDLGPSMSWGGIGVLDPRYGWSQQPQPGQAIAVGFGGYFVETVAGIPTASAVNNIAASAIPVAGTAMTLTATTSSVVNKITTGLFVLPSRNIVPAGALALDTVPGILTVSSTNSSIQLYNPSSSLGRAVKVVSAGNDTAAHFLVSGYDIYGYPMTEYITGVSGATASGKKAFKFVTSVLPSGTVGGSNVSIGTLDVFGFPIATTKFSHTLLNYNSAVITAVTGFVAQDATLPATSTTGDVRGTYAVQSAADGVKQLTIMQMITPGHATGGAVGLFGSTQA